MLNGTPRPCVSKMKICCTCQVDSETAVPCPLSVGRADTIALHCRHRTGQRRDKEGAPSWVDLEREREREYV